jgi:hypothetical protein
MRQINQQEIVKFNGWKKIPQCPLLVQSEEGKLYCAYDYDLFRREIQTSTVPAIFDDIGLNQSYKEALARGDIVKECSPEKCPSFLRKLGL